MKKFNINMPMIVCKLGAAFVPIAIPALGIGAIWLGVTILQWFDAGAAALEAPKPHRDKSWYEYWFLLFPGWLLVTSWIVWGAKSYDSCLRYWHPEEFHEVEKECEHCKGDGVVTVKERERIFVKIGD